MPDHNPGPARAARLSPWKSAKAIASALPRTLDRLLTGRRAVAWCGVLLLAEIVTLLVVIAGTHGMFTRNPVVTTTDFSSFYAAGRLADEGHPALAYDQVAHYAEEQRDTSPGVIYSYFYYPPMFLLLCALLGRLPYLAAFIVFQGLTAGLYVTAAIRVLARKHWAPVLAVLAFPANFWNFGLGQNGFLTGGLFGFATLLVDKRPMLAGMLFGSLIIKPHFGLLVPVALLAGMHWRAIGGAMLSVAILMALSLLFFGADTWTAFLGSFADSPSMYQSGSEIGFELMVSVFGAMRMIGFGLQPAYAVQVVATCVCVGVVFVVWQRRLSLSVRAATLLSATVVAVPLILFYDLTIVGMAVAWLCRRSGRAMSLTERLMIGSVFACALIVRTFTTILSIPFGLIAACLVLGIALCRAAGEIKARALPMRSGFAEQYP